MPDPDYPILPDVLSPSPDCDSPAPGLPFATFLDPHETSDGFHRDGPSPARFDLRTNLQLTFRHSFWARRRRSTYVALQRACNLEPSLFGVGGSGYVSSFAPTGCVPPDSQQLDSLESNDLLVGSGPQALALRSTAALLARSNEFARVSDMPLKLTTEDGMPLRLVRFAQCGSDAWVLQSIEDSPRYRVVSNRCRDRFCEACQRERRATVSNNVCVQLEGRDLRLLTLTLKSSEDPLRYQLNRLYKCFRLFRQRKQIKPHLYGGLFFSEVTLNDQTRLWHPHLHVIFEGEYLPHEIAKRTWLSVTGDSFVVDIRSIRSSQEAADHVAKYASKGISSRVWTDPVRMTEAILALSGRRTFSVFGKWRGLNLSETPTDSCEWKYFGRLCDVIILAKSGDDSCARALRHLLTRSEFETADYIRSPPGPD